MTQGLVDLKEKIRAINEKIKQRQSTRLGKNELRDQLQVHVGAIYRLPEPTEKDIEAFAQGKPILVVDGSINQYGVGFPHIITLIAAVAHPSVGEDVVLTDPVCPLLMERRQQVADMADEEGETAGAKAFGKFCEKRMAALEVQAAIEAIRKFEPALVIFDGGFKRYQSHAPREWKIYKTESQAKKIPSVGVIEEMGTDNLATDLLQPDLPPSMQGEYDREVLFGVLETREWLQVGEDKGVKRGFYTCFARPSYHPQPVAYDFFREDIPRVKAIAKLLFALTPIHGRGVPLVLDQVDQQVKITSKETEDLITAGLDKEIRELLLRPMRDRRPL